MRSCLTATLVLASFLSISGSARAQSAVAARPNTGALTFTGGLDAPSVYVFRGIVQESAPRITLWPYGDIGLTLASGDGAVKRLGLNIGIWNSLQTGSSGSDGFTEHLHYEEDFYTTLSLGLARGLVVGATYTAYTSPNLMFDTVKEASVRLSRTGRFSPYGVVAFELGEHGADGGTSKGTYVELGVGPSLQLRSATLSFPVKLGLSAKNYYERAGVDHAFGYLDVGVLIAVPISRASGAFGAWNVHAGLDVLTLGETTKAFNAGETNKVVGLVGIGVTY